MFGTPHVDESVRAPLILRNACAHDEGARELVLRGRVAPRDRVLVDRSAPRASTATPTPFASGAALALRAHSWPRAHPLRALVIRAPFLAQPRSP